MSRDTSTARPEQVAFSALLSGAYASATIALLFLVFDLARGAALFTPSLMGTVLLLGEPASATAPVRHDMVALYSLVHFSAFAALGAACTFAYVRERTFRRYPILLSALIVGVLGLGAVLVDAMAAPGLLSAIGPAAVTVGNIAAAIVMALFIHGSLRHTAESPAVARFHNR